jgi:hypothetical protein
MPAACSPVFRAVFSEASSRRLDGKASAPVTLIACFRCMTKVLDDPIHLLSGHRAASPCLPSLFFGKLFRSRFELGKVCTMLSSRRSARKSETFVVVYRGFRGSELPAPSVAPIEFRGFW